MAEPSAPSSAPSSDETPIFWNLPAATRAALALDPDARRMDGVVQIGDRADVVRDDAEPWTAVTRDGGASEAEIVVIDMLSSQDPRWDGRCTQPRREGVAGWPREALG